MARIAKNFFPVVTLAWSLACGAQTYPTKPIRLVVPYPPGAFLDVVARLVTPSLGASLGQPVVADNRPGAGESLGAELVARSAPDGYTLLVCSVNGMVFRPALAKNVPYDPVKDFTPLIEALRGSVGLVANDSVPARTMAELIAYAKANPGKASYGTAGIGTSGHLIGEQLQRLTGAELVHVPYKSAAQPLQEVMAGQIPVAYANVGTIAAQIKSGRFHVLATSGATRNRQLPDVPTISEVVPEFKLIPSWTGMVAPAGLPAPLVARLSDEMRKAFTSPAVKGKIESMGFDVWAGDPQEFAASIRRDVQTVRDIAAAAKIPPLE